MGRVGVIICSNKTFVVKNVYRTDNKFQALIGLMKCLKTKQNKLLHQCLKMNKIFFNKSTEVKFTSKINQFFFKKIPYSTLTVTAT